MVADDLAYLMDNVSSDTIANDVNINTGSYLEKTTGISFQTSSDINSTQVIYEQGGRDRGLNIYVHNGKLFFGGWNTPADESAWAGVARDARIGHVHLQVGDTRRAEAFFGEQIGLDLTCRYPGASFFSRDGYHHHIAANSWNSAGAAERPRTMAGLQQIALGLAPGPTRAVEIADSWGVRYQIAPRRASSVVTG